MSDEAVISFSVRGDPQPQPRPRVNRNAGNVYYPGTADAWKSAVRLYGQRHFMNRPWTGPVGIVLDFFLPHTPGAIPGDWYCGTAGGATDGDWDNLGKAVCDALNPTPAVKERGTRRVIVPRGPGIWEDDRLISSALVNLRYAEAGCAPGLVFQARRLGIHGAASP